MNLVISLIQFEWMMTNEYDR